MEASILGRKRPEGLGAALALCIEVSPCAGCSLWLRWTQDPGTTVEQLRAVQKGLEEHRRAHGRLPDSLTELDLDKSCLRDGYGNPLVYSMRRVRYGAEPGPEQRLVVGVSRPIGLPFTEQHWFGIFLAEGELSLRRESDPLHGAPFLGGEWEITRPEEGGSDPSP